MSIIQLCILHEILLQFVELTLILAIILVKIKSLSILTSELRKRLWLIIVRLILYDPLRQIIAACGISIGSKHAMIRQHIIGALISLAVIFEAALSFDRTHIFFIFLWLVTFLSFVEVVGPRLDLGRFFEDDLRLMFFQNFGESCAGMIRRVLCVEIVTDWLIFFVWVLIFAEGDVSVG